jgi:succinate dehydrogenase flavin-adding protein (antitoxin of CptAB toxin-antitoxin module)
MSNILKVTTPMTGYDNSNQVRSNPAKIADTSIQGQINPDKVMKPDARSDSAQGQDVNMKFQYESNFGSFVQQMKDSPTLAEEFSRLFLTGTATIAESGLGENFAQKLEEFMNMIEVRPQDLTGMLKGQSNAAVRYSGAFFSLFRQVMGSNASLELKAGILDFLRRYTDMVETPHLMGNIRQTLNNIKGQMYRDGREQLEQLEGQLNGKASGTAIKENLDTIRGKILPFLNLYISRSHERGEMRDLAALLASYAARCENGLEQRVQDSFEQLMRYPMMQKYFQGFESSALLHVLANTEYEKASRDNQWMDKLSELIRAGAAGEAGSDKKAMFQNMMQSILLNESVYMPVLHMMLPLQIGGRTMFAEMWVDPDADESKGKENDGKKAVQGLVKFDIKEVGFFDLFFLYQDGNIRIQINCPEKLGDESSIITRDIKKIMSDNGISAQEVFVESSQNSIKISDAFPKIFERKNSVNVRI